MKTNIGILAVALMPFAPSYALAQAVDKQACAKAFNETNKQNDDGNLREAIKKAAYCVSVCTAKTQAAYQTECTNIANKATDSLATVVLDVTDATGASASAVTVTVDGQPFAMAIDKTPLKIEPGVRVFTFDLAGQKKNAKVELKAGEKNHPVSVSFKVDPLPPPPPTTPTGQPTVIVPPPPPAVTGTEQPPVSTAADQPSAGTSVPVWAWLAGGLGIAATGASVAFAVVAINDGNTYEQLCTQPNGDLNCSSSPEGRQAHSDQSTHRGIAIGFGAGAAVGIGLALVGILTAPKKSAIRASVLAPVMLPRGGGLAVRGAF